MLGYEMPCAISGEAALRMHHGEKGTIITPGNQTVACAPTYFEDQRLPRRDDPGCTLITMRVY